MIPPCTSHPAFRRFSLVLTIFGASLVLLPAGRAQQEPPANAGPGPKQAGGAKAALIAARRQRALEVDGARFAAWQRGDYAALGPMIDDDVRGVDGLKPDDDPIGKEAFLQALERDQPPPSAAVSGRVARVYGTAKDVAIVTGIVKDPAQGSSDPGAIYSAVYIIRDLSQPSVWSLIRYFVSPLAAPVHRSVPPSASQDSWSVDSFSPTQQLVLDKNRLLFDDLARRQTAPLDKLLSADFWYIRATPPAGAFMGKKAYVDYRKKHTQAAEIIAIDNPNIDLVDEYGDVALIDAVRRDSPGGGIYGDRFSPHWKSAVHYLAVVVRTTTHSNEWRVAHYHEAIIVAPAAEAGQGG